jgi:hypothetical protein
MPNDSRTTWLRRALVAAALAAIAGCHPRSHDTPKSVRQQPSYAETPSPEPVTTPSQIASDDTSMEQACPEPLAKLEISSVDTAKGVALVFATPATQDVEALRIAVHRMAGDTSAGSSPSGSGVSDPVMSPTGSHAGSHGMSHDTAMQTTKLDMVGTVAVDAKVVETPDGAKIELTPKSATELEALRGEVRQQVAAMQVALCPDEVTLN